MQPHVVLITIKNAGSSSPPYKKPSLGKTGFVFSSYIVITGITPLLITVVVIAFALPMSHFVSLIFRKNGDESLSLLSLLLVPMFRHNATLTRRQISMMKQSARRTSLEYHLPQIHYEGGFQFVIKIGQNFWLESAKPQTLKIQYLRYWFQNQLSWRLWLSTRIFVICRFLFISFPLSFFSSLIE